MNYKNLINLQILYKYNLAEKRIYLKNEKNNKK